MKRAVVLMAFVGLGCAPVSAGLSKPSAGSSLSVHLSFDATDAPMGGIVTASITAAFTDLFSPGTSTFGGIAVDLVASRDDVYKVIDVAPVVWNNPGLGFTGQGSASGASVIDLQAAQFSLVGPVDPSNPILITTFTLQRIGTGSLTYSARVSDGFSAGFFLGDPPNGGPPRDFGPEVFTSDTLLGTPSPGVLGVLGVGGVLVAGRRRVG